MSLTLVEAVAHGVIKRGQSSSDVALVQTSLVAAGQQLYVDRNFGPITEAAVQRFQAANGLVPDGEVGRLTAPKLDDVRINGSADNIEPTQPPSLRVAPWLSYMRAITGTKEVPGAADNPLILGWVKDILLPYPDLRASVGWYNHDSVAWCGLTCGWAMAKAGYRPPKLLLGAANWYNDWTDGVHLESPALGALLVKEHHVTMVEGQDAAYYYCRGGNQSDTVNVIGIRKNDSTILGFMWPRGYPRPETALATTTLARDSVAKDAEPQTESKEDTKARAPRRKEYPTPKTSEEEMPRAVPRFDEN